MQVLLPTNRDDIGLGARTGRSGPVRVFYSYAHVDEWYKIELAKMLAPLRQFGRIDDWHDRHILPGDAWENEVFAALREAEIALILVSKNYLDSPACQQELHEALKQGEGGSTIVVPIIVSPCLWSQDPRLRHLQAVPTDARPVSAWPQIDEALLDVASRLIKLIETRLRPSIALGQGIDLSASLWNVPYSANPHFANRSAVLDELTLRLRAHGAVALHGGPGLGKSMLAVECANRLRRDYRLVWWLRAENRLTLETDLTDLARALGVAGSSADPLSGLREWCRSNTDYLLIFDNAVTEQALSQVAPTAYAGHVLVTSRTALWSERFSPLALGPWSIDEAADFLVRRTGRADAMHARKVAELIGGVPLALEQVASVLLSQSEPGPAR